MEIEIGQGKEQLDIRFSGKELVIRGLVENATIHYRSHSAPDPHLRFPIEVERAMMPGRLNRPLRIEPR